MSFVIRYNGTITNGLLKYLAQPIEIISLEASNTLIIVSTFGFLMFLLYTLQCGYKIRQKKFTSEIQHNVGSKNIEINYFESRHRSMIDHKKMLSELEYAADKCFNKLYALHCIDIVTCCPHLVNMKSSISGLTPFHRICLQGHTTLIEFMLKKGADPFLTTVTGENALCMVIHHFLNNPSKADFSCLDVLQNTGCSIGSYDKWYDIFLTKSLANSHHQQLAQWLILHGKASTYQNLSRSSSII